MKTSESRKEHNVPFQRNLYVLDRDAEYTSKGKHKRVVVSMARDRSEVTGRVDAVEGDEDLPWPTDAQVLRICKVAKMNPPRTKLVFQRVEFEEEYVRISLGRTAPTRWYVYEVQSTARPAHH